MKIELSEDACIEITREVLLEDLKSCRVAKEKGHSHGGQNPITYELALITVLDMYVTGGFQG